MDADLGIMQFYQKRSIPFIFVKTLVLSTQIERVSHLNSASTGSTLSCALWRTVSPNTNHLGLAKPCIRKVIKHLRHT